MISIIIPFYNEEKYLGSCIKSILKQNYTNFELILIDDCSTDNSAEVVKSFNDNRIIYKKNESNQNAVKSRNIGLELAKGEFIFFADADCVYNEHWLEEGLKYLQQGYYVVEGKCVNLSKYRKISEKKSQNLCGGSWAGGNVAYRADVLKELGGFDPRYSGFDDRELGLRVSQKGPSIFNEKMLLIEGIKRFSVKGYFSWAKERGVARVLLYKYYGDTDQMNSFIAFPKLLARIIFPFLIFRGAFRNKNFDKQDLKILLIKFPALLLQRFYIWKTAIRERIFVL